MSAAPYWTSTDSHTEKIAPDTSKSSPISPKVKDL